MYVKVLVRWMAIVLASTMVIASCSSESSETSKPPQGSQVVDSEEETSGEPANGESQHQYVQDLWVYERVSTITAAGIERDLTDAVVEGIDGPPDNSVELTEDVTFHVHDSLKAKITDADGVEREDLEVVAGVIEHDGERALSVLATPALTAAASVRFGDQVQVDLTYLGEQLQPGDPIFVDFGFLQAYPNTDDDSEANATGLELLSARMAEERVGFFGEEVDGEHHVLVYSSQPGEAVEGSTTGLLPAKAHDMRDGMVKGLRRCRGGLKCVSDFFKGFGEGAKSSFEQGLENGGPGMSGPPRRHPTCYGTNCARSWGEPHLRTFDGVSYDMQAVGEFIAMSSDEFEVQLRTRPYRDFNTISIGTAVAIAVDDHRITVDIEADEDEKIRIDGDTVRLDDLRNEPRQIGEATVTLVGDSVQIDRAEDRITIVNLEGRDFIDLYLDFAAEKVDTQGLLGTANGDQSDDFTTREGEILNHPLTHEELYGRFVESWRIAQEESLFDYADGTDTDFYTDRSFPQQTLTPASLEPADRTRAEAVCRAAGIENEQILESCVFDYAVTGDISFVRAALTAEVDQMIIDGQLDPTTMPVGGRGDQSRVSAELTIAPYEPSPDEIVWLFTNDDASPQQVPEGVEVSPIRDANNLDIFEITDRFGYPTDPILRVSPLDGATTPALAREQGSYIEFEIAPTAGPIEITQVQLAVGRGRSGDTRRGVDVRSSADGYESSLLATDISVTRPDMKRFASQVTGLRITEPTTFRLYIYTSGTSHTVEIGDLALTIRPA